MTTQKLEGPAKIGPFSVYLRVYNTGLVSQTLWFAESDLRFRRKGVFVGMSYEKFLLHSRRGSLPENVQAYVTSLFSDRYRRSIPWDEMKRLTEAQFAAWIDLQGKKRCLTRAASIVQEMLERDTRALFSHQSSSVKSVSSGKHLSSPLRPMTYSRLVESLQTKYKDGVSFSLVEGTRNYWSYTNSFHRGKYARFLLRARGRTASITVLTGETLVRLDNVSSRDSVIRLLNNNLIPVNQDQRWTLEDVKRWDKHLADMALGEVP